MGERASQAAALVRAGASAFLAALLLGGCGARTRSMDEALAAYQHIRVGEAEDILRAVAADRRAQARDRAEAHRQLGRIAWLVDGDADRALAEAARAYAAGDERCATARMEARVLGEAGRGEALLSRLPALAAACPEPGAADRVRLYAAAAALDRAAAGDGRRLADAGRLLGATSEEARAGLQGSALALQLALVRGDPQAALRAWKDYFWLSEGDLPQALAASFPRGAAPVFAAGLAPAAPAAARLALVDLLVRAGFAREAERFAAATGLAKAAADHPLWRKAAGYFEARRALEAALLASNRRAARGGPPADIDSLYMAAERRLVAAAGLPRQSRAALLAAYGLYGEAGKTDGYPGLNLGHAVRDERLRIEQYGHRTEARFIALDNMIANGFDSWLWDGDAATGGWTEAGPVIVEVRSAFTEGPLTGWSVFRGGPARARLTGRIAARAASDAAALEKGGVAFLPGLADRLRLQLADQVGARAAAAAGRGDLRRAYLDEYRRAAFQQAIFIHEGRHALDRRLLDARGRRDQANLEYRAKLSELALADYPRLALFNIDSASIGGNGAHGVANRRILEAYADWIRGHKREIAGYDPALPPLVQADKLGDAQIRAVARSLDPLAR
ncbi:MAG: hypothetical protein JOZ90_12850 [Alphaproteobacteria bacterium]|nr:hypothetical protein [Alphaproteobacteria bacterium]MBV9370382.1 hypothetical protein [Alphaproteobacteria bacterium]MBV9901961.1 hypothetical protein [Alphaproteobacteria bacterium]